MPWIPKRDLQKENDQLRAQLAEGCALLKEMKGIIQNRTMLASVEQKGRVMRFGFIRNGALSYVEAYADMSVNVPELRKQYIEPLT